MTSQKSLKNNINTNDFVKSLTGALLFPVIALILLFVFLAFPVIIDIPKPSNANAVSYFLSESSSLWNAPRFFQYGMVLCGMLTAIKQYSFIMSKKQVNIYLSFGISRVRLFVNRAVSALILLFAAAFIPLLLIYIFNIIFFGLSAHLTGVFLYLTAMFFISSLAGFAMGAFAVTLSGSIFEAGFTCISVASLGPVLRNIFYTLCDILLRGYAYNNTRWMALFSPFSFVMDLNANPSHHLSTAYAYVDTYSQPIDSLMGLLKRDAPIDKYQVPEDLLIDAGFIIPLCVMLALSVAALAITLVLFKRRKAENANSLGHFKISAFLNSSFVFTEVALIFIRSFYYTHRYTAMFILFVILAAEVPLLAYFITQLVLTRKIKATVRSLIPGVALSLAVILVTVVFYTGVFGLYNKTPDKESLESVAIDVNGYYKFNRNMDFYDADNIVYSDNDSDIDMVLSVFDTLKDDEYSDDWTYAVAIAFKYNNGKVKYRSFPVYTDEAHEKYLKSVIDSNYFDEILEEVILGETDMSAGAINYDYYYYYAEEFLHFRDTSWYCLDSDGLVDNSSEEVEKYVVAPTEEFLTALYNDLSSLTYEQIFKNNTRPLGLITYSLCEPLKLDDVIKKADDYYYSELENFIYRGVALGAEGIYIYPEMKETIAYLEGLGFDFAGGKYAVKEILYTDTNINIGEAADKYHELHKEDAPNGYDWYYYDFYDANRAFDRCSDYYTNGDTHYWEPVSSISYYIPNSMYIMSLIKNMYEESGHPLISVTEQDDIDRILNGCVPFYMSKGDDGRYAYVIYENGIITAYYIPNANLDVLK